MGATESRSENPLLQKRKFSPEERRELRKNVYYNPDEEFVSGIEHSADKVRRRRWFTALIFDSIPLIRLVLSSYNAVRLPDHIPGV